MAQAVASEILAALGRLRLAPRQVAKDVTLWPLVLAEPGEPAGELWPLEDAMEDGFVGVGAPGTRGRARVESRAPVPVWVAAGERLGGAGIAGESVLLPARSMVRVRVTAADPPACSRCCAGLAGSFRAVEGQVGFVAAVHERALALELVLPGGGLARRLHQRLLAWAPFLLAEEAEPAARGFDSPEALLAWLSAGRPHSRAIGVRASILVAGPAGCARLLTGWRV